MNYQVENETCQKEECKFADLVLYLQTLWEAFVILRSVWIKRPIKSNMLLEKIQSAVAPVELPLKVH